MAEALKAGDVVRRKRRTTKHIGRIERFSTQGDVRMAWVRWAESLALPNPEPVPQDTLERVTES